MDQLVRAIVWIALFGGTGVVIVVTLPQIVIWCLEIVENFQKTKSRRKALLTPHKNPPETPPLAAPRAQRLEAAPGPLRADHRPRPADAEKGLAKAASSWYDY